MELAHKVGRFAVGKGGDGIIAGEGSTGGGGGTRVKDLAEVGRFAEVDGGGIFRKLRLARSKERMWRPSRRIRLSFGRPR